MSNDINFIIKEKYKCAKSPIYYLNTYGHVFDASKKKITKMTCFSYQERCIKDFHKFQNNIVLKSRQCLPGYTLVDTLDGQKEIQNIKTGDFLYSYNLNKNITETDIVSDVWCSGEKECVKIDFDNTESVESGENHPFYEINKKDWIRAQDLIIGDEILNSKKEKSVVKDIQQIGLKICYDISVKKNENFFINGLLVHNTGLSVVTAGYVAWRLMFRYEEKILIIANQGDGAIRFLETVKQFIDYTPEWLKPAPIAKKNQTELEFAKPHSSWIKAKASSPEAGRGESLTMLVLDETAFIKDDEQIWMGAGMALSMTKGKCIMISCVPKETMVFTDSGIKEIGSFIDKNKTGGYEVEDYQVYGKDKFRGGNLFFNNGLHETKILQSTNAEIEGTLTHKLWACKEGKYNWYKMQELDNNDFISVQYGMEAWGHNDDVSDFVPSFHNRQSNTFNPAKITKEIAYLIGLYISEGSVYKKNNKDGNFIGGSVTIACGDDVSKTIDEIGLSWSSWDDLHYSIGSKNLIEFLEYLGFDLSKKDKEKEIPNRLFEMSRENIIYMLRGIFDGDGYSSADKGYIGIGMNSKKLIKQIRMLLLNFGVLTDYYEVLTKKTKLIKVNTMNFRISANGEFSKVFYDKIGFDFERKQNNEKVLEKYNLKRNVTDDVIPFSLELIKKMVDESGYKVSYFKKQGISVSGLLNKKKEYKTKNISRGLFLKLYDICKSEISDNTKQEIEKILSPSLKWNKINKIEYSEKETYDFSLPNNVDDFWCHSVIYNGVLGHQTPNGTGNLYHQTWVNAVNGDNDFNHMEVHWTENPSSSKGLEIKKDIRGNENPWSPWYDEQCKRLNFDSVKIAQELDLSFEGSKYLALEGQLIEKYEKQTRKSKPSFYIKYDFLYKGESRAGRFVTDETPFHAWKEPEKDKSYVIGVDVARGDGKDYSTIEVFDVETLEQVAEYRDKIGVDLLPYLVDWVGRAYNNAYLVVEANSFGLSVGFDLRDKFHYKRMFYSKNIQDIHVRPNDYKIPEGIEIPGFQTTRKTRPLLVKAIMEHMREGNLILHSQRLVSEMKTFIMKGDRPEAEQGYNDDLIFALGLALYVRDTEYNNVAITTNMYKTMLDSIIISNNSSVTSMPEDYFPGKREENYERHADGSKDMDAPKGGGSLFVGNEGGDGLDGLDDDMSWLLK